MINNCVTKLYDKHCDDSTFEPSVLAIKRDQIDEFLVSNGRVYFNLKEDQKAVVLGSYVNQPGFSKSYDNTQALNSYTSSIDVSVNGLKEETINEVLAGLESDYFVAVKTTNQDVLIYGFDHLLTAGDYTYTDGSIINLESKEGEFMKPLFFSQNFEGNKIGAKDAFDNLFQDLVFDVVGDFNDDFNDDFYK